MGGKKDAFYLQQWIMEQGNNVFFDKLMLPHFFIYLTHRRC